MGPIASSMSTYHDYQFWLQLLQGLPFTLSNKAVLFSVRNVGQPNVSLAEEWVFVHTIVVKNKIALVECIY